ncbi:MAG: DUF1194 domain-containing protein [Cyanobacteria bacterium]|nr:DUF1194 domain-containing protein [Cyanobacteriota bacterium]
MSLALATLATSALATLPASAATFVTTELVLSVDASASVNGTEFNLQRQGYVNAFRDPELISLIEGSGSGIAVTLQYWSTTPAASLGWFHITDAASAESFAAAIEAAARPSSSFFTGIGTTTNIAGAINAAASLLTTNDFIGDRLVIDVSGDGRQNENATATDYCGTSDFSAECLNLVTGARNAAVAKNITINGLPILTDIGNLDSYFQSYVIGGEDAFVQPASSFADFETALKTKVKREISVGLPEPEPEPEPEPVVQIPPVPAPPVIIVTPPVPVADSDPQSVPEPSALLGLLGLVFWASQSLKVRRHA